MRKIKRKKYDYRMRKIKRKLTIKGRGRLRGRNMIIV